MIDVGELTEALGVRRAAIARDGCGDKAIFGRRGHIYGSEAGFYICAHPGSGKGWYTAKRKLAFCDLTQDGDDEGVFRFTGVPTPEQAVMIRSVLELPKRRPAGNTDHLKAYRFT